MVLRPESRSKISNLVITELFYSHIHNMKNCSLHKKAPGVYISLFLDTMALLCETFPGLSRNGPQQGELIVDIL